MARNSTSTSIAGLDVRGHIPLARLAIVNLFALILSAISIGSCASSSKLTAKQPTNPKPKHSNKIPIVYHDFKPRAYMYFMKGVYALEDGRLEDAEDSFRLSSLHDPNQTEPKVWLGRVQLMRCLPDAAMESAKAVFQIEPNDGDAWEILFGSYMAKHEWQYALDAAWKAYEFGGKDSYRWYMYAESFYLLHDDASSLREVLEHIAEQEDDLSATRLAFILSINTNNVDAALKSLKLIRQASYSDYSVLFNTVVLSGLKHPSMDFARQVVNELLSGNPSSAERLSAAFLNLRWLGGKNKERKSILRDIRSILTQFAYDEQLEYFGAKSAMYVLSPKEYVPLIKDLYSNDDAILSMLAERLIYIGSYEEAYELLLDLERSSSTPSGGRFYLLLKALAGMNRKEQVENLCANFKAAMSDKQHALRMIACDSVLQRSSELVKKVSSFLSRFYSDLDSSLLAISYLYDTDEQGKATIDALEFLLSKWPQNIEILNFLGYAMAEHGIELDRSECLIRRAYAVSHTAAIRDSLAWNLFEQGECKVAERLLELSAQRMPFEPEILWHLAQVRMALGRDYEHIVKLVRSRGVGAMSLSSRRSWQNFLKDEQKFVASMPNCR